MQIGAERRKKPSSSRNEAEVDAQLSPSEAPRTRKIAVQVSDSILLTARGCARASSPRRLLSASWIGPPMDAFVYAAIDRNEQVLNFCISGGLSSSGTGRGEFSSNGRKEGHYPSIPLGSKSYIRNIRSHASASRRAKAGQFTS